MLRHDIQSPADHPRNVAERILFSGWGSLAPSERELVNERLDEVAAFLPFYRAEAIRLILGKPLVGGCPPPAEKKRRPAADLDGYKARLRASIIGARKREAEEMRAASKKGMSSPSI